MSQVMLQPVTRHNWHACAALRVSAEQQVLFPFSVLEWIAESRFEPSFELWAIEAEGTAVGFAVLGEDEATAEHWLIALMIDARFQRRGYGRAAMQALTARLAARPGCRRVLLGHRSSNAAAAALYAALGFVEIDRDGHEIIRALDLKEAI
ncbi:MAG TPA: GNAT family N-acetyltransferase [Chitinolyticbacter sp.]|nr:GNAT family N-acetyltransferase [Chitinolyticbacter sp.]